MQLTPHHTHPNVPEDPGIRHNPDPRSVDTDPRRVLGRTAPGRVDQRDKTTSALGTQTVGFGPPRVLEEPAPGGRSHGGPVLGWGEVGGQSVHLYHARSGAPSARGRRGWTGDQIFLGDVVGGDRALLWHGRGSRSWPVRRLRSGVKNRRFKVVPIPRPRRSIRLLLVATPWKGHPKEGKRETEIKRAVVVFSPGTPDQDEDRGNKSGTAVCPPSGTCDTTRTRSGRGPRRLGSPHKVKKRKGTESEGQKLTEGYR